MVQTQFLQLTTEQRKLVVSRPARLRSALQCDRHGQYRLTFDWRDGDAWRVDLEDYH
jgi:plasmid maintenance system killer protein